jgi:2TM domain
MAIIMENQDELRVAAKKKVKKLKSFYSHLAIYVMVNIFILIVNYSNLDAGESYFQWRNLTTLFFWGIGVSLHALATLVPNFVLGSEWEEKKIEQLMNYDQKTT